MAQYSHLYINVDIHVATPLTTHPHPHLWVLTLLYTIVPGGSKVMYENGAGDGLGTRLQLMNIPPVRTLFLLPTKILLRSRQNFYLTLVNSWFCIIYM